MYACMYYVRMYVCMFVCTLEDILYRRLQDLWAPLTDSMKVFNENGAAQPLCAQKVWEALLTAFPLDHKLMQTALLARELARMMRWDGDSKRAFNLHFASVTELHRTMVPSPLKTF